MSAASRRSAKRRKQVKKELKKMAQKVTPLPDQYPISEDMFDPSPVHTTTEYIGNPYTLIKQLGERENENTPDWRDRKIEDFIPVFVYGTLKSGGRLHSALKDAFWLGDGVTASHDFGMWDTGSFPVVRPVHPDHDIGGKIFGEIYMVDPTVLLDLDRIESNGYMYQRRQVWIWAQDQKVERTNPETGKVSVGRPGIEAWMYEGVQSFWRGRSLDQVAPKMINGIKWYDYNQSKGA